MAEEVRPEDLLRKAISGYLGKLPPRFALSAILRTVWGTPAFVELRKRLSEEAKELSTAYREVARETDLGRKYASAAERARARERFRSAWIATK